MQTEKQKHIEQLLERFFDGQTSNAEEQELYSFFNSSDVPEALKSYQPVFGYFETGIREELNEKEEMAVDRNLCRRFFIVIPYIFFPD